MVQNITYYIRISSPELLKKISPEPLAVVRDTTNSTAREALPEFSVTQALKGVSASATVSVSGTEKLAAAGT